MNDLSYEIWKNIDDFSKYQISNQGQIKVRLTWDFRLLKSGKTKEGYSRIMLYRNNRCYCKLIHRLVLEAFVGKCPEGLEANHKDGVKANNHINNLEWITHLENAQHAVKTGLYAKRHYHYYNRNGEKNSYSKLKNGEVWLIKRLLWFDISCAKISRMFKVHADTICTIKKGETWQHVEFEPTYKDRKHYKETPL